MPILGAHMSIAGGYHKAVERALAAGCECVQIFTKNNNQWRAAPLSDEAAELFCEAIDDANLVHPIAHTSYLLNIASPNNELWQKSVDGLVVELNRATKLKLEGVVLHPGAYVDSSLEEGIERIVKGLREALERTEASRCRVLLENTAGQGTNIGWQFDQLQQILTPLDESFADRLGICFDTCHAFAAGYDMRTEADYKKMIKQIRDTFGIKRIKAIHANDSKKELGTRVDRHENIGKGFLGDEAFRLLLTDRRFAKVPVYIETPKGDNDELDEVNLQRLRRLAKRR